MDLNDSGEVVGGATDASGNGHAFTWTKVGGLKDLGMFGGLGAGATGVSNGGVVVGTYLMTGVGQDVFRPFIINGTNPTPGNPPGCDDSNIVGITSAGLMYVGGYVFENDSEDPVGTFVYSGGKYTAIGVPSKTGISQIKLGGKAAVFGYYGSETGPAVNLWEWDGNASKLFDWVTVFEVPMPGWGGIGAKGEALGTLKNGHAGYFSANGAASTDTGHAGTIFSLNASGQAVGNFTDATGQKGFYWTKAGGFKDLNTMIDPSLGVTITATVGINANGQIICFTKSKTVASGLFGIGALLTPNVVK
jgi:probable HAF family extracellular repeat protein